MAVTKSEADGAHPASHYLVVPDPDKPSTWGLRVKNTAGDYDHGLCGAAYAALTVGYRGNKYQGPDKAQALARLKAIYRRQGWPLPDSQHADTAPVDMGDAALFALSEQDVGGDDDVVVRSGLIFKAGDYRPKRDFAITPEELSAVAAAFNDDLPNELEHFQSQGYSTFLDGKLGRLVAIWASEDGAELFGDVEVPRWLDRLWAEAGRKVSTVWDTAADGAKRLVRLGLVLNPVVQDATLFAEYAQFAGQRHSNADLRDLQTIHDIAVQQGATCPDQPTMGMPPQFAQPQGATTMPDGQTTTTTGAPPAASGATDDALKAMQAQFAEMQTQFAQTSSQFAEHKTALEGRIAQLENENKALMANYATERTKRVQGEAVAFADAQIAAGKAFPYERESLATDYLIAVEDDAQRGPITFAEGQPPLSRVEVLQKKYAAKPAHGLTTEQMRVTGQDGTQRPPSLFALSNIDTTPQAGDEPTQEQKDKRRLELLNMSDLGRRTAAAQNGK